MKKIFLVLFSFIIFFTASCAKEDDNIEEEGPFKYDLTLDNVQDFMTVTITDLEIISEHFLQYKVNLLFNIDDEEGDPSILLLISFEIDIDLIFSIETEDGIIYVEQNFTLGAGAEGKDKVITQEKQITHLEHELTNLNIIFDSIRWNIVDGYVILKEKYR